MAFILCFAGCSGDSGPRAIRRGMRALEKGRHAESITWFQRALPGITSNNERAIVLNGMGIAYYRLGRKTGAMRLFEESSAADAGAPEPVYNLGIVAWENGDGDKAVACFEKAAILNERDPRALEFLAVIHGRQRQWDDARRVLKEAARHAPSSPRILSSLAVLEVEAGNINRALELLQEALEKDAHYAPAVYNLAVINQRYLRRDDQALPLFTEYSKLAPSGRQGDQVRLIIKNLQNNRPPQPPPAGKPSPAAVSPPAVTAETAEISAAPSRPPAAVPAVVYPSFEELMRVAEKLEKQNRREAAFNNYLRIARAAEQSGRATVANQAVKRAISLAEGNAQAAYDLGVYFAERNKKEEALPYFKAALTQDANPYPAAMALARLALEKNEFDTAIISLKKADELRPEDPEALWLLAGLYDQQLSLTNSAAAAYNQFAARFPHDSRAPEALGRLKAMNFEFKPPENSPVARDGKPRSFWERMFRKQNAARQ